MANNQVPDTYGTFRDTTGTPYLTPDNKPPSAGTSVKIPDGYGNYKEGTWSGGYVTPNKT